MKSSDKVLNCADVERSAVCTNISVWLVKPVCAEEIESGVEKSSMI